MTPKSVARHFWGPLYVWKSYRIATLKAPAGVTTT